MLKKILKITLSMLLVACVMAAAACSKPNEPKGGPISISLHASVLELFEDDETALIAQTENFDGQIVWSSSDETVATVSQGIVKAEGAGSAVVTATAGTKQATCSVTVTGAGYVPMIETSGYSIIEILEGNEFDVPLSLLYKGIEVVAESYSVQNENTAIATAQVVDGALKVSAVSVGETEIQIKATYRGKDAYASVSVIVKDNFVLSFMNEKVNAINGVYSVEIDRAELKGGKYQGAVVDLGLVALDGEKDVVSSAEWNNTNDGVVTVTSGVLTATGIGESKVTVKCKAEDNIEKSVEINVKVNPLNVDLTEKLGKDYTIETKELTSNPQLKLPEVFSAGTLKSVKIGETSVEESCLVALTTVYLDKAKLDKAEKGRVEMVFETELVTFSAELRLCDKLIETKEDLESINSTSRVGDTYVYDGYYMLGNDIDYSGDFSAYAIAPWNYNNMDFGLNAENDKKGFVGTFDGDGHYIKGIEVGRPASDGVTKIATGFFGQLGTGGVVKNVAFVDAKLRAVAVNDMHGFLAHKAGNATVDNVLITGSVVYVEEKTQNNMLFGYNASYGYTLSNSVLQMTHVYVWPTMEVEKAWNVSKALTTSSNATYKNVFVNSAGATNGAAEGVTDFGMWNTKMWSAMSLSGGFDARYWSVQSVVGGSSAYSAVSLTFLCFNNCAPYVWVRG